MSILDAMCFFSAAIIFQHILLIVVKGEVQELSTYTKDSTVYVLVSHNSSGDKRAGANWMTTFEVTDDVIRGNKTVLC